MAEDFVYKPSTRKGPVFLAKFKEAEPPRIRLPDGRVIEGVPGDQRGGVFLGKEGYQWVFDNDVLNQKGAVLEYGGKTQKLDNSNLSYRGTEFGKLGASNKGAVGEPGPDVGEAGYEGSYSVKPEDLRKFFPSPELIKDVDPLGRPYEQYVDPVKFASEFGRFAAGKLVDSFTQARRFGQDTLDAELESLRNYTAQSSQLIRKEVAADNLFNQAQRTGQIDEALPSARSDYEASLADARAYREGRLPSAVDDRALELGIRSEAADLANASGFGSRSSVARKASDLMSANQRMQLNQFGIDATDRLTRSGADLFLAPTSYSAAGANMNVMPTVSPASMLSTYYTDIANRTTLDASSTWGAVMSSDQRTNEFNKTMEYNVKSYNAGVKNDFAMSMFGYLVNYANAIASAGQYDLDTRRDINQQTRATDAYGREKKRTQRNNTIRDGVRAVVGGVGRAVGL